MSLWSNILDLFFPPKCVFCTKVLDAGGLCICPACQKGLPYTQGGDVRQRGRFFDECVSPLRYEGAVRDSILRYKFKSALSYADCYGSLLAGCIRENLSGRYNLITWVPLSAKRARSRGYDQAMLLARTTASILGSAAVETLVKTGNTPAQSTLHDKDARRANVSGVYKVKDRELIDGKNILLIDDIITTGATLSEAARVLLQCGAESVVCAALARA